jgi:hypothetical protein
MVWFLSHLLIDHIEDVLARHTRILKLLHLPGGHSPAENGPTRCLGIGVACGRTMAQFEDAMIPLLPDKSHYAISAAEMQIGVASHSRLRQADMHKLWGMQL